MKTMNKLYRVLIFFCMITLTVSCSKEEDEVKLATVETVSFDSGYLMIKMNEVLTGFDPSVNVTSIDVTNVTKGTSFQLSPTLFTYLPSGGFSVLSSSITGGNTGDQMNCVVSLDSILVVGIGARFESVSPDSIVTPIISSNVFNSSGVY